MNILLKIVLIAIGITIVFLSVSCALYYKCLYVNLHRNFKSYMTNIDRKYIEVDVILHNAIYEAYESAKEKGNTFEEKAYEQLYKKIKTKW